MQITTKNLIVRKGDQTGDYSCCKLLSSSAFRKSFYCSMVGIAVFLLSLLFSNSCFAYSASLSTSGDIELDITPTSSGATAIAEDELTITSTCPSGYTLYLSGTSDNSLYLEGDNTTTAAPISASSASLANPDLLSPNTWGFSLSSSASSFAGLTDSLVAIKSPTGQASTDESFSVYYAANANLDRVGGTYTTSGNSTTLTYTLMPELACFQFTLRFNGGTDDESLEGSMANQEILSGETNVISPNQFKRVGYVFAGWSTAEGETLDNLSSDELYFCGSYCDEDPDDAEGYAEMIPHNISDYLAAETGAIIDLYVVWRPIKVVYDGNAGSNNDSTNAVEGSMGTLEHSVAINEEITLYAPNYSRTGYGNAGWSTNPEAGTNLSCTDDPETVEDECDGFSPATVFGPNATVAVTAANFPGEDFKEDITLYAVWIPADTTYTMQTFNSAACSALTAATYDSSTGVVTPGSVLALRDERDDDVYTVAKLADGRCWMTENLRLDNTANWDRNLSDDFDGAFVGLAASEAPSKFGTTSANSLYSNLGGANANTRIPRYNNQNTANRAANPTSRNANIYSYGNYYTFASVIADTTYFGTSSTTADSSICAKGWHAPTFGVSGNSGEFNTFFQRVNGNLTTNSIGFRAFPTNGVFTGMISYNQRAIIERGSSCSLASNWVTNSISMGATKYRSTAVDKYSGENKNGGYPLRCILNNPETYTLAFNANGGSGKPANQTLSSDRGRGAITITDEIPTHSDSNLVFVGWSTDSNATEATYQPGDVFTAWKAGTTYTLYAIWQPFITVHFDGNGATSGSVADQAIPQGTTKTLRANAYAKTGYKFVGWGSSADATTLAYADKASYTAPASVTQGDTDTLYALWREPYSIVYDGNGADEGSMSTAKYSNVAELNTITLYASNFSREGYGFIGWSFDPEAGDKVNTSSQPTIYGPNETITVPARADTNYDSSTGNATLYAVWVPADTTYTMQTFDSSDFSSEPTGYILALKDERDNDVYAVAKLADGNFWMIENLRLDAEDTWGAENQALSQGYSTGFVGLAPSGSTIGDNTLYTLDNSIEGDEDKQLLSSSIYFPSYSNSPTANRRANPDANSWIYGGSNLLLYSGGNLYSFPAATASVDPSDNVQGNIITNTSICAKGWHLPAGTNAINNLINSIPGAAPNGRKLQMFPTNFITVATGSASYYVLPHVHHSYTNFYHYLAISGTNYIMGGSSYNTFQTQGRVRCVAD